MSNYEESITHIHTTLPKGKELGLYLTDKRVQPNRYQIGSGMNKKEIENEAIDAITVMSEFTPQEWYVIQVLKNVTGLLHFNQATKQYFSSCIVSTKGLDMPQAGKNRFSKGYKRLKSKNLVKRIKRQLYIINPDLIVPTGYAEEAMIWDEL